MEPLKTFYQIPKQSAEDTSLPQVLAFLTPRPAGIRIGGAAAPSPQRNFIGALSRLGDRLFARFPSLADRLILRLENNEPR